MSGPSYSSSPFTPDRLVAGDLKLVTEEVTLTNLGATGALTRGTVLGRITASGIFGISLNAAVDGSQTPVAILADDADPSGGDVQALIYRQGEFNEDSIILGTGQTLADHRQDLANVGIFIKSPVSA